MLKEKTKMIITGDEFERAFKRAEHTQAIEGNYYSREEKDILRRFFAGEITREEIGLEALKSIKG